MVTIGENLKLERYTVLALDDDIVRIKTSVGPKAVSLSDITEIELIGIKNNSGYSGTMEWWMKNPTFLLPTHLWFSILNWFKRQEDDVYFKMVLHNSEQFVVFSSKKMYKQIEGRVVR